MLQANVMRIKMTCTDSIMICVFMGFHALQRIAAVVKFWCYSITYQIANIEGASG